MLRQMKVSQIRKQMAMCEDKYRKRFTADGPESQDRKYINVAIGAWDDIELTKAQSAMEAMVVESEIVSAPLLLATTGGSRPLVTAMPLATSTVFAPTKKLIEKAYKAAKAKGDPDLDVERDCEPKWTTHSLRRAADTVARRDMKHTETPPSEIDIYFGWHEKVLLKDMQVHYSAMSVRERMKKARITSWM